MRILFAPDDFKGTLTAAEAAIAMAKGWSETRPDAECVVKPMSDGGPGFVHAMAAAHGVATRHATVVHSLGEPIDAAWCMSGDTAYVEAAAVVGLDRGTDVYRATTVGLGELLLAAVAAGARRVVFGLGGTNINDAGAGMLSALGARAFDEFGQQVSLVSGPRSLARVSRVDLGPAEQSLAGVQLIAATDVDVPLLGPRGATFGFAAQKGASADDLDSLEAAVSTFAAACGRRSDGRDPAVALGAGSAGGLGFALLRLGAMREPGIETVWCESGIDLANVDLVVTGEGCLDWQSMRGKVVSGVARKAQAAGLPAIALAGSVRITPRERSEMGLDAMYSAAELFGEQQSMDDPAGTLQLLAARVARTWG